MSASAKGWEEDRMVERPTVTISFKDLEVDEELRETLDKRCSTLAEEFPEADRFEITLSPDGAGHGTHARVSGRNVQIDTHASAIEMGLSAERAIEKVARQLRREHDKRIFARRREAQKENPKRGRS
jgi:ribosome-associated translation inhibitor RaiA